MEFNGTTYLQGLHGTLKATKTDYRCCKISGVSELEEVLLDREHKQFFAIDDSQEGSLVRGEGNGWFERRPYVVYLMHKLDRWPDMQGRETTLLAVREIFHKLMSKINLDFADFANEGLAYLNTDVPFYEVPGYFGTGAAGVYFIFTCDVPTSIVYNANDWE